MYDEYELMINHLTVNVGDEGELMRLKHGLQSIEIVRYGFRAGYVERRYPLGLH